MLEEVMIHEGVHTLFNAFYDGAPLTKELRTLYDYLHAEERDWTEAVNEDPTFVCTYARDSGGPWEDLAESFVAYFAIRYRLDRISERNANLIREAIPNRIAFFDNLNTEGLWCPIIAEHCLHAADEQHAAVAVAQESAYKTKKMNNDNGGIQIYW